MGVDDLSMDNNKLKKRVELAINILWVLLVVIIVLIFKEIKNIS